MRAVDLRLIVPYKRITEAARTKNEEREKISYKLILYGDLEIYVPVHFMSHTSRPSELDTAT
jgi:hypothetical protein